MANINRNDIQNAIHGKAALRRMTAALEGLSPTSPAVGLSQRVLLAENFFMSDLMEFDGTEQTVAHGLGAVPQNVMIVVSGIDGTVGTTKPVYGTHTATNCLVTSGANQWGHVIAFSFSS